MSNSPPAWRNAGLRRPLSDNAIHRAKVSEMRHRRLDANGDMTFGQGQSDFWIDQPEGSDNS
jgi:hypothetical protein